MKSLSALSDLALCFVRKWWRPLICLGISAVLLIVSAALIVSAIYLPIRTGTAVEWTGFAQTLAALAALIGSVTPFAWLRTKEKIEAAKD